MKYVIIYVRAQDRKRVMPFLFSEDLPHESAAEAFTTICKDRFPNTDCGIYSAGYFTPEVGALRGAQTLNIARCDADTGGSREDDFIINVHDKTHGVVQ
jgi:hypothetical protein